MRKSLSGMNTFGNLKLFVFALHQTLMSAPLRGPVTTPALTTLAALSACATKATSSMALRTVEVSIDAVKHAALNKEEIASIECICCLLSVLLC